MKPEALGRLLLVKEPNGLVSMLAPAVARSACLRRIDVVVVGARQPEEGAAGVPPVEGEEGGGWERPSLISHPHPRPHPRPHPWHI